MPKTPSTFGRGKKRIRAIGKTPRAGAKVVIGCVDPISFMHNLRTVVLDPQRRIHRQFDGTKWKAEELAEALSQAAQVRP